MILHLPSEIVRCPGTITDLYNEPIISGGIEPYDFTWNQASNYIVGDCPDCQIDLTNLQTGINFTLEVTDANGCEISQEMTIATIPLNITNTPTDLHACTDGPGENTLSADVYGGSGNYIYQWTPSNHLTDPYDLNTTLDFVFPVPDGEPITETYTLLVTDEYGCTQTSDPVLVTGSKEDLGVDAGRDLTICYGTTGAIGFVPANNGQEGYYYWTSDNDFFEGANTPQVLLSQSVNSHSGDYIYTLHGVAQPSGCVFEDEVEVTVYEQWAYSGYESALDYIVIGDGETGEQVDLWEPGINDFLSNPQPSGHAPPLTYKWIPEDEPQANVTGFNNDNIPSEGTFAPTKEAPYLKLRVSDHLGCFKDIKTNRYLVLGVEPSIHISSNQNLVACAGEWICFDIEFDAHLKTDGSTWLPTQLKVDYGTSNPSGTLGFGYLTLTNPKGLYTGSYCVSQSGLFSNGGHHFTVTITNENDLFAGLSEEYYFIVTDDQVEVPEEAFACGYDYLSQTQNGNPSTLAYSASGMKVHVGRAGGNISNCQAAIITSAAEVALRAGTTITFYPDFDLYNEEGGQLIAFIDPCLTEEEFTGIDDPQFTIKKDKFLDITKEREIVQQPKQNLLIYPNPFTGEVAIEYHLDLSEESAKVSLNLLSVAGSRINVIFSNQSHKSGNYKVTYDGRQLPPGVYFYELIVENQRTARKAIKAQF